MATIVPSIHFRAQVTSANGADGLLAGSTALGSVTHPRHEAGVGEQELLRAGMAFDRSFQYH